MIFKFVIGPLPEEICPYRIHLLVKTLLKLIYPHCINWQTTQGSVC